MFCRRKPLFIIYGDDDDVLNDPKSLPENIKAKKIKPSAFGHHHTLVHHWNLTDLSTYSDRMSVYCDFFNISNSFHVFFVILHTESFACSLQHMNNFQIRADIEHLCVLHIIRRVPSSRLKYHIVKFTYVLKECTASMFRI